MKRQRHIRTHVLATMIGLTCGVLLVVIAAFNLSVRGYVRARVAAQLDSIEKNASEMWRGGMREHRAMEPFENRPDRETGMRGSGYIAVRRGAVHRGLGNCFMNQFPQQPLVFPHGVL